MNQFRGYISTKKETDLENFITSMSFVPWTIQLLRLSIKN